MKKKINKPLIVERLKDGRIKFKDGKILTKTEFETLSKLMPEDEQLIVIVNYSKKQIGETDGLNEK